jgi:hypothetical protein
MHKIIKYAIIINIVLTSAFIYGNYSLWNFVNGDEPLLISSHWGPFTISTLHHYYNDGQLSTAQTVFFALNIPFWLFWIAIAANLFLIIMLGRRKNTT